jgi:hypothetical protein
MARSEFHGSGTVEPWLRVGAAVTSVLGADDKEHKELTVTKAMNKMAKKIAAEIKNMGLKTPAEQMAAYCTIGGHIRDVVWGNETEYGPTPVLDLVARVPELKSEEYALRIMNLAGTIVVEERGGRTCYRLPNAPGGHHVTRPRHAAHRREEVDAEQRARGKKKSPWEGWKSWSWEQFERAIHRTVAGAKDGPALQTAVDGHVAKVNAIFSRLNAAYARKEVEIGTTEFDPGRRQRRLDRLFHKFYGIKRGITRKADRMLIRSLRKASAE